MTRQEFQAIEGYMLDCMKDSAHDRQHVYRVLYSALDIAEAESGVDDDVLIAACLLHDIGRERQAGDLELDHAALGGAMAEAFLSSRGWEAPRARAVRRCVETHRYRKGGAPQSVEAKILFDADKLEAAGAIGVARTMIYGGQAGEPLCVFDERGRILTEPTGEELSSFFQEFNYKLRNVYDKFYTARAKSLAEERKRIALDFYDCLYREIQQGHDGGAHRLEKLLK